MYIYILHAAAPATNQPTNLVHFQIMKLFWNANKKNVMCSDMRDFACSEKNFSGI